MGVARQIGQHRLRSGERTLGIDHPFDIAQWRQICGKRLWVGQRSVIAEELQLSGLVCGDELLQEQPAEQPREHADGEEEAGPASDPLVAVQ